MPDHLDTSVIVRYLMDDLPEMAGRAAGLIDSEREFLVTTVALAETAYVLRANYGLAREEIVDVLVAFVQRHNVGVQDLEREIVVAALLLCRPSSRVSFADALIWASARRALPAVVYTFNRRFPAEGLEVREP